MSETLPAFRTRFVIGLAICLVLELVVWMSRESHELGPSVVARPAPAQQSAHR
jgi:hypothetical protein